MNEENSPTRIKFAYWVVSTVLVISLMVAIFGIGQILWAYGFTFHAIWGFVFVIVGLVILYFYSYRVPYSFYNLFLKRKKQNTPTGNPEKNAKIVHHMLFEEILGTGLIVGGIIYSISNNLNYVIGAFTMSVWLMRLMRFRTED